MILCQYKRQIKKFDLKMYDYLMKNNLRLKAEKKVKIY